MKCNRWFWAILTAVVLAVGVLVVATREREPEYGGKKLSEWVVGYAATPITDSRRRPSEDAADAIGHSGTNALPYLLKWIRYEQSGWKTKLNEELPLPWKDQKQDLAGGAADAFGALGSDAQRAIPELTRILNDPNHTFSAIRAARALAFLGKDAIPPLLAVLTNQQAGFLRIFVAQSFRDMGTNIGPFVPVLIKYIQDKDSDVAANILATIYNLRPEPVLVVPALVNVIDDLKSPQRHFAILVLGRYGSDAGAAVPALLKLLRDPDAHTRTAATTALREIDPDAFEKATAQ